MKLLIIGNNYSPEPTGIGVITTEFAQLMAARGHSVTVATTFPHYPQWRWQGARRLFRIDEMAGVTVRRMWTPLPLGRSALWRIMFDAGFAATSLMNATRAARPDVIIAVCPPIQVAFTAAALGRLWGVPTCLWVKDLPLDAALDVGLVSPGSLTHRAGSFVERHAYRSCSEIVVLHERFAQAIARKGVPKEHLTPIPNWVSDIEPLTPMSRYRRDLGARDGDFLLLHAGNMGAKQGLSNILAAARLISPGEKITFAFMGDGPQRSSVIAEAARLGLTELALLPLQPSTEVPHFYAAANVLLLYQKANVVDSVVPMKMLSYMAAGKPILAAVHPESVTAEILRDADCGLVVPPNDPAALADAARKLSQSSDLLRLGNNGRRYMEQHFAATAVMAKWEALLSALCSSSPSI